MTDDDMAVISAKVLAAKYRLKSGEWVVANVTFRCGPLVVSNARLAADETGRCRLYFERSGMISRVVLHDPAARQKIISQALDMIAGRARAADTPPATAMLHAGDSHAVRP